MDCTADRIPYRQTGNFNKIVVDYVDQLSSLKDFFAYTPSLAGIKKAIEERKQFPYNRNLLVQEFKKQYATVSASDAVNKNIEALSSANTFTITTAHQNNISAARYILFIRHFMLSV
jgi:hypothetical protein